MGINDIKNSGNPGTIEEAILRETEGEVVEGKPGGISSQKNQEVGATRNLEVFRMGDKTLGEAVDLALANNGPSSLWGINIPSSDSKPWKPVKVSDVDSKSTGLPEGTLKWVYSDGTQTLVVYEYPDGKKVTLPGDLQFPPLQELSVCLGIGEGNLPVFETSDGHKFYRMPNGRLVEFHNNEVPVEILKAKIAEAGLEIVSEEKVKPRYESRPSFVREMVPKEMRPLFESEYVMVNDPSEKVWKIKLIGEGKHLFVRRTEDAAYKILQFIEENGLKKKVTINGTPDTEVKVLWDPQVGDYVERPAWAGTDRVVSTALYEAQKLGRLSAIIDNLEFDRQTVLTKDVDYLRGELRKKAWSEGEINDLVNVDDPAAQSRAHAEDLFSQAREDLARSRFNGVPDKGAAIDSFSRTLVNMGVEEGEAMKAAKNWYRVKFEPATPNTPGVFTNQVNPGDPARVTYLSDGDPLWVKAGNEEFGVSKGLTVVTATEPIPQDRAQAVSPDAYQHNVAAVQPGDVIDISGIAPKDGVNGSRFYQFPDGRVVLATYDGTWLLTGDVNNPGMVPVQLRNDAGVTPSGSDPVLTRAEPKLSPKPSFFNRYQPVLGVDGAPSGTQKGETPAIPKTKSGNMLGIPGLGFLADSAVNVGFVAADHGVKKIYSYAKKAVTGNGERSTGEELSLSALIMVAGFAVAKKLGSTAGQIAKGVVTGIGPFTFSSDVFEWMGISGWKNMTLSAVATTLITKNPLAIAITTGVAGGTRLGKYLEKKTNGAWGEACSYIYSADDVEADAEFLKEAALGWKFMASATYQAIRQGSFHYDGEGVKNAIEIARLEDATEEAEKKTEIANLQTEALTTQMDLLGKEGPAYDQAREIVGLIKKFHADNPDGSENITKQEEFIKGLEAQGVKVELTTNMEGFWITVEDPQTHTQVAITWNPEVQVPSIEFPQIQDSDPYARYGYGYYAVTPPINLPKTKREV